MLVILAVTLGTLTDAIHATEGVTLMADTQENLRRYGTRRRYVTSDNMEWGYTGNSVHLEPGDALFLYTDGVPEADNAALEQFTDERLALSLVPAFLWLPGDD